MEQEIIDSQVLTILTEVKEEIRGLINKVNVNMGDEYMYCEQNGFLIGLNKTIEIINNKIDESK